MGVKIERVLNNNTVVSIDKDGKEIIVMGLGIAFQKKPGSYIPKSKIEKIFSLDNKATNNRFMELVSNIPAEYVMLAENAINISEKQYNKKLNDNIYISLTDHIYSAIQRYKNGIQLKNALLWDIKRIYREEYEIGLEVVKSIKEKFDIDLLEDEAAFIALHIVNAEFDVELENVNLVTTLIQDILKVVRYHFSMEFDENSLNYNRFLTHLKFFAQRLVLDKTHKDDDEKNELYDIVKKNYALSFECVKKIEKLLEEEHKYKLTKDEKLYLMIHISKIMEGK